VILLVWLACRAAPEVAAPPEPAPTDVEDVEDVEVEPGSGLFQRAPARDEIAALEALGYAEGGEPATDRAGVTRHDPRAAPGRMLWTSGHAAEAMLMDLDGQVLHTWRKSYDELFPTKLHGEGVGRGYWRRVVPFDDGSLLAVFEAQGLVKLDRDSKVLWSLHAPVHHDVKVAPDGSLWTLTRKAHVNARVNPRRPILEDYVAQISPDGAVLREVSVLEAVLDSEFASMWAPRKSSGDLFHTNAIVYLDGRWADRLPEWKAGRVLVSVRAWHALLVIDLDAERVVWAAQGDWKRQHDPRIHGDNLLLFDNMGLGEASRILELDPVTMQPVWSYVGTAADPFFSRFCGAVTRGDDGVTLISDSWAGRAFEVNREGEILWEFINPHRAGDDPSLIAVLPEMIRLPADYGENWLKPLATAPK
jgi:hypothetical protein